MDLLGPEVLGTPSANRVEGLGGSDGTLDGSRLHEPGLSVFPNVFADEFVAL